MADSDLKDHALNSAYDFYELLDVPSTASETEIRRAYRKTALKYHPDKVGPDPVAAEKFHNLQIAYDVLSDDTVRQLYDNARRAREEKKEREAAYEGRRKNLKEELERREQAGAAALKRKRGEAEAEDEYQRELNRIAADGKRRREERTEQLRKELQEDLEREKRENGNAESESTKKTAGVEEIDRTIKLRYPADSPNLDEDQLRQKFSHFGKIQDIVLKNKKIKIDGEKHRREYIIAIIVFESIVGAHAAVTHQYDTDEWAVFENVTWASGKEPESIPKPKPKPVPDAGSKKAPTFSFKAPEKSSTAAGTGGSASSEETMMMRLKNAERRRQERLAAEGQ